MYALYDLIWCIGAHDHHLCIDLRISGHTSPVFVFGDSDIGGSLLHAELSMNPPVVLVSTGSMLALPLIR